MYVNIGTITTASWVSISDPRLHFEQMGVSSTFYDDFAPTRYVYTDTNGGGTTAAVGIYAFGDMLLTTAATDNSYQYYTTPGVVVDVDAADTAWWYEARLWLSEANVDDANWWCGFMEVDDVDADVLADDGAGPKADYEGCLFWKVNDGTSIEFEVSKSTTQESQTMGDWTSGAWTTIAIRYDSETTIPTLTPYLNGVAGTAVSWIYSANQAWVAGFGVKAGDNNAEALSVDYHKAIFWPPSGQR